MATTSQSFPRLPADIDAYARERVVPLSEVVPVDRAISVLDLVGKTPLLEIARLTAGLIPADVRIFAKLEGFNPGGSVKDRPAKKMLEVGIAEGKLKPGKVILDSTSGNTGIALAMLGATRGQVTHFVAAIGTGGTVMGTGRFLKSKNSAIKVIAVEPDDAMHGLEGLKHMASSIVPGIYHEKELDDKIPVGTEEAYEMVYALGQTEGILVGQSSGAAMIAALKLAQSIREGNIVTVFCDFGDKYLSTNLWIGWQEWRRERLQQVIAKWNNK